MSAGKGKEIIQLSQRFISPITYARLRGREPIGTLDTLSPNIQNLYTKLINCYLKYILYFLSWQYINIKICNIRLKIFLIHRLTQRLRDVGKDHAGSQPLT